MSIASGTTRKLEDTYAGAVPDLVVPWSAAHAPAPRLVALNTALAAELGLSPDDLRPDGLLVGRVPEGVTPVAQAYAGHQFGMYQPSLGDGRALLLGELVDPSGARHDLHLKGSGRTPFARGGDGKAALGPMLREHLMGEAMHALGIPTSRGLAVTATGEDILRESGALPGAVLTRVAASHLRIGTFQYAAVQHGPDVLRALADHAIARHHPHAADAAEPYLELYRSVIGAQASLVARWMSIGFVHGVMNTDNTTISGETIDYGPCALIDAYDPSTVFSSIDHAGRYAFGRQPQMAQWNLARLGEALLPLIDTDAEAAVDKAVAAVDGFVADYERCWLDGMAAKLGLRRPDRALVDDLLALLRAGKVDWTSFFRTLSADTAGPSPARDLFADRDGFDAWAARWEEARDPALSSQDLDRVNPLYVPRNHLVEEALDAATDGDIGPFEHLLDVVTHPYEGRPGHDRYAEPGAGPHVTYCGT